MAKKTRKNKIIIMTAIQVYNIVEEKETQLNNKHLNSPCVK